MAVVSGRKAATVNITKGDLRRSIAATLKDAVTGAVVDLTGADVYFRMVSKTNGSTVVVNSVAATVDDASAGTVHYDWQAGDVDEVGVFAAWWIVEVSGKQEHYPSGRAYIEVNIAEAF